MTELVYQIGDIISSTKKKIVQRTRDITKTEERETLQK